MRNFLTAAFSALLFAVACPAGAAFHIAHISEVVTSLGGDSTIQFVEIEMAASSQTITTDSVLGAFDVTGDYLGDILVVPGNITNGGSGVTWLMATAEFAATTGLDPDFVFPAGLPTESGMVCWGAPGVVPPAPGSWSHFDPDQYVDCLAYGDYGGATAAGSGAPAFGSPDGHSLQRISDTGDNETDFACGDPATPTNNGGESTDLVATEPCSIVECGDGVVGQGESCDDGNTVNGDGCDAACQIEALCGDGVISQGESCDDGNTVDGDGCDAACQIEALCGDAVVQPGEDCDDGNTTDGDGCPGSCVLSGAPTKDQQACVNELNKRFAGVLKARNKVALKCLKNFAKGKVPDFESCAFGADAQITKAAAKTTRGAAKKCSGVPFAIGLGGADAANEAADEQAIAALRDVLGNPANPALKSEADVARCQAEVAKNLGRLEDGLAKAINKAKKAALRGKQVAQVETSALLAVALEAAFADAKVVKVAAKATAKIGGRCPAGDLSAAFPGSCDATSAGALAGCAVERARCRVCLAIEDADNLELDCDATVGAACPGP